MAFRTEKNGDSVDIVIDGFEKGIADDPYTGIADIRNANILSTPKEAAVQFANAAVALPPTTLGTQSFQSATSQFSYLVVGSGGGGGQGITYGGGGGGGGQVLPGTITGYIQSYSITVAAGGAAGTNGSSSSIAALAVAVGGGAGGSGNGSAGASGGGGGGDSTTTYTGGVATAGFNGGNGITGSGVAGNASGGGGGGAGGAGGNGVVGNGGAGGLGVSSSISGSAVTYGGGGGGGGITGGSGNGGGGNGNSTTTGTTAGAANRGGGGGSSDSAHTAGAGGSGVVIISYPTGTFTATGGTITTSGGNTIHTFNSSSTFQITAISGYTANTLTVASTAGYVDGMAIKVVTSTVGGATAGNLYYIGSITSTAFKLYLTISLGTAVTITSAGSGTFTVPTFGKPFASVLSPSNTTLSGTGEELNLAFIVDDTGNVWMVGNGATGTLNQLYYTGNIGHTIVIATGSIGIGSFKGYILVLLQDKIDYIKITTFLSSGPTAGWVYGWQSITASEAGHKALSATDDAFYFCNGAAVGSILQNSGSTFNPGTPATYTVNTTALALPSFDAATCLAQLGTTLLVGGIDYYIYPWDRISTSFSYPLIMGEAYTKNIVSTNANAYIFAGKRGRIYITNGANVDIYKDFPDQISNTENPYYQWGAALYFRNQLYFGVSATTNAGVAIDNFAGVWAIDLATKMLYLVNSLSTGSYAGSVPVLVPMGNINPAGNSMYVGWINGSSVGGIDYGTSLPYVAGEAYIDTDMIPVGTYYEPATDQQIEYKLAKPLVAGESVQIFWRGNLTDSFTQITNITAVTGRMSGAGQVNFQKQQWVQLRIKLSSTAATPSYVKLREIRMR